MTLTKACSSLSVGAITLLIAVSGAAQPTGVIDTTPPPPILVTQLGAGCQVFQDYNLGSPGAALNVRFAGSQWIFHIDNLGLKGPWIDTVSFKGGSWSSFRQVIKQAGLAEIYVQYHNGNGLSDLQFSNPNSVDEIKPTDLPIIGGGLVTLWHQKGSQYEADPFPRIGVECHERGIDWLCKRPPGPQPAANLVGRAYEVIVWAVIDGGNYDNILQYVFRDDGSLGFRLGTSGYLNQNAAFMPIGQPHMHNALWRLSTNLFGRSDNRVYLAEHNETTSPTSDKETLISAENFYDWDPLKFTSILVQNKTLKNTRGNLMGYELTPWGRTGTALHSQSWLQHDFWITKDRPGEDGSGSTAPDNWRFSYQPPGKYMVAYASPAELLDTSMTPVLWYRSSFHHHKSDHDLDKNGGVGIVSTHWAGFDFQPDNTFDFNPLTGGASKCGP